jgi:Zn-dependent protease
MFGVYPVGRPFGVEVRLHGSMLLIAGLVLVVSLLASGVAGALASLLTLAAVFGCVTLHELGHIGAARLFGNRTDGVTLYPFGGVAALERPARGAAEEVIVAAAGPAVNVVLAGLAALPVVLLGPVEPFLTLLQVNIGLALFNLIPAFPMDGGRILRGLLWRPYGEHRATWWAARAGQAFAALFGAAGLLFSPMLMVIAVVVFLQASAELARLRAVEAAGGPFEARPVVAGQPRRWTGPMPDVSRLREAQGPQVRTYVLPDGRVIRIVSDAA